VGEALTVPILKASRAHAESALIEAVLARIVRDESAHAELGLWFLDWADASLSDDDRTFLGRVAGAAVAAFAPIFSGPCGVRQELGVLDCQSYDATFQSALSCRVIEPLALRGIDVPPESIQVVTPVV
jgi:hypothetical protein